MELLLHKYGLILQVETKKNIYDYGKRLYINNE